MGEEKGITRRSFLKNTSMIGGAVALGGMSGSLLKGSPAFAASEPIRIGVVLPFSRSYKVIGDRVFAGLELAIHQAGGEFKGRKFEFLKEDSEMKPNVALTKTKKLVEKDGCQIIVGPVSSAAAASMRSYIHMKKVPMILPTAGNALLTGKLFSPYLFRASISHWIFAHPMGYWVYDNLGKSCFLAGANYAAGQQQVWAFNMAFRSKGGETLGSTYPPLNEKDYAPYLTKIADSGAEVYFGWFAGNDAVNFCRQADRFGLKKKMKVSTSGWFFERNLLTAQKEAAEGWFCCFNWAITLDNPVNKEFVKAYNKFTNEDTSVSVSMSSVHGYDAGQMILKALEKTGGDTKSERVAESLKGMKLESPRGPVELDAQHDLVQPMYVGEIVKSGDRYEAKIIDELGRWTTPSLGANNTYSVGEPFIV